MSNFKQKQWNKAHALFQDTHACNAALSTLTDGHVVIIVGRKGDGKTTIAREILLKLQRNLKGIDGSDAIIVEIEEPDDLIELCSRGYDSNVLVLVDDAFGKSAVDTIKLDKWQRKADDIWDVLIDSEQIHIVMTLRKHIWNKTNALLKDYDMFRYMVDLTSSDMALRSKEKANILTAHLEKNSRVPVDFDLVNNVSSDDPSPPGFPQCCSMFSSVSELYGQGLQFFRKPSRYMQKLLDEHHVANPTLYVALALALVFGGRFSTRNFSKAHLDAYPRVKESVEEVLECCSGDGKLSLGQLRNSFKTLLGVFFEIDDKGKFFRFNHDSVEEAVARHFGTHYPEVLIKCCRLKSLQQWVCTRLEDQKDHDQHVVFLGEDHFQDLCERLNKELLQGSAETAFSLMAAKDDAFVATWVNSLKNSPSLQKLLVESGDDLLTNASKNGVELFIEFLLSERCGSWYRPSLPGLNKAVKCAACGGYDQIMGTLLNLEEEDRTVDLNKAFEEVMEVGHVNVAKSLLNRKPELIQRKFSQRGDSYHRRNESFCKTCSVTDWKQAIHLAAYHGSTDILTCLLDRGLDPNTPDSQSKTALHHGSESGYKAVVHILLSQKSIQLELKDKHSRTALHYAAKEGHADIVELLVAAGMNMSAQDIDGNTPYDLASSSECTAVVGQLLVV